MDADPDRPILYCQYCGSRELLNESNKITVQRIKSKTYKDIELEKLQFERDKEKERIQREDKARKREKKEEQKREAILRQEEFTSGPIKVIIIWFFWNSIVAAIFNFLVDQKISGVIAIVQAVFFAFAWLKGMQFLKEKRPGSHIIYAVIGFLLIIPLFGSCGISSSSTQSSQIQDTFDWPDYGIFTVIPEPFTNKGDLNVSSSSIFVDLDEAELQDFYNYVEECKSAGFDIDVVQNNTSFEAYNGEGYRIKINYFDSDSVWIDLYEPEGTEE